MSAPAVAARPLPHERRVLFEALGVSVIDFRCRSEVQPEGGDEPNSTHSIVLVRRGVFARRTMGRELAIADPNHVLFFNASQSCRFSHPLPGGDDCTIVAVETHKALDLVARYAPRLAEDDRTPFRVGAGLSTPRVASLHYEMLGLVRRGGAALAREDVLAELVDQSVAAAYGARTDRAAGGAAERKNRERVEATKLTLNERVDSPPRLSQLARLVDCSPFHLSRIFRHTAGVPLRRYAKRLRVRAAAERLALGERNLTALALDLGYADHSHFTNAFRDEWGMAPSRFRAPVP